MRGCLLLALALVCIALVVVSHHIEPARLGGPSAGYFLTKIFHPNISKTGEICVNTLKKDWRADLGIGHVLQVLFSAASVAGLRTKKRLIRAFPPSADLVHVPVTAGPRLR